MNKYDTVFFDLDGTLIESGPAIFATTRATLAEMGLPCPSDDYLRKIVGPPLKMGFTEFLNVPESRIEEAVELYREKAKTMGVELAGPYGGILELLAALKERGIRVGIVTAKVHSTAMEQLSAFHIAPYVDYARGAFSDGHGDKAELLGIALRELSAQKSRAVMVGDRYFDLNAARDAGIESIGVLYGYGEREELEACAPTHIVESVEALRLLLLSQTPSYQRR